MQASPRTWKINSHYPLPAIHFFIRIDFAAAAKRSCLMKALAAPFTHPSNPHIHLSRQTGSHAVHLVLVYHFHAMWVEKEELEGGSGD